MLATTVNIFLHLDHHLNEWAGALGPWLYLVLFLVVFCETGLVIAPYLPGDSLLFAVGALASKPGSALSLPAIGILLSIAAILGDAVNYSIGAYLGPKVFHRDDSMLLNKKHLERARLFYEKHGGKTIILARFIPVIRTFAPFVAGIGRMGYFRFALFNVVGGLAWTWGFLVAGYCFAELPIVKNQFHYVILAIIVISFIPVIVEFVKTKRESAAASRS